METILAIDLGKNKSVFCEFDRGSLKTQLKRRNLAQESPIPPRDGWMNGGGGHRNEISSTPLLAEKGQHLPLRISHKNRPSRQGMAG